MPPGKDKEPVQIIAVGDPEGVTIIVNDTIRGTVLWSSLNVMEVLVIAYATLQVWQFQVALELLGQMNKMQSMMPEMET